SCRSCCWRCWARPPTRCSGWRAGSRRSGPSDLTPSAADGDADAEHAGAGLGTGAVRAAGREHHVAARAQPPPPVDELTGDHVVAFLALVHVHHRPLSAGGEVVEPAAGPLGGGQAAPEDPGSHLDRVDLVDLQDLYAVVCRVVCRVVRHAAMVTGRPGRRPVSELTRTGTF